MGNGSTMPQHPAQPNPNGPTAMLNNGMLPYVPPVPQNPYQTWANVHQQGVAAAYGNYGHPPANPAYLPPPMPVYQFPFASPPPAFDPNFQPDDSYEDDHHRRHSRHRHSRHRHQRSRTPEKRSPRRSRHDQRRYSDDPDNFPKLHVINDTNRSASGGSSGSDTGDRRPRHRRPRPRSKHDRR